MVNLLTLNNHIPCLIHASKLCSFYCDLCIKCCVANACRRLGWSYGDFAAPAGACFVECKKLRHCLWASVFIFS